MAGTLETMKMNKQNETESRTEGSKSAVQRLVICNGDVT